jgi:threonine-phosphate decarboxylase
MMEFQPLHGGQLRQIADRFGIPVSGLIDFSASINPEGPPAAVPALLRQALDELPILTNYPDLDEIVLRQALARYADVRLENVVVANGFVPLLDATLRILPIRTCLVPVPAFVEYRRTLERALVEMIPHVLPADSEFSFDTADLFSRDCDAILLANPQNPSGVLSSRETLLRIAGEAAERNIFVLLDEAFIDYTPTASLAREVDRFPNLIVFRSVTKFFGMAGLRIAYAAANAALRMQLQESIAPWSVTSLASLAAGIAVQDEAYTQHTMTLNKERRDRMQMAIENLSVRVFPSAANFILLRLPGSVDRRQCWERLIRQHRIVLRNCFNYEGLGDGHLRAAVRTERENGRLVEALAYELDPRRRIVRGGCAPNEAVPR